MDPLEKLRERLAELSDLRALAVLAHWDQMVMMPAEGGVARGHQVAALEGLTHRRATSPEISEWLDRLEHRDLDALDADLLRIARRDFERASRVPEELAAARAKASADGHEAWVKAREQDDFRAFVPSLTRNVELARSYGECVAAGSCSAYDALLGDYDFGLRSEDLRRLFSELSNELPPLAERAAASSPRVRLEVPVGAQEAAVASILRRVGVERGSWRVDVSAHPFTTWMARRDTRITTRYEQDGVEALLSSLHEYGHALYERQIDAALDRTNLGEGTSMSVHESQSKLWENHVARSRPFAEVMAADLEEAGFSATPAELHAALVGVEASPIRVSADPLTYPLHIVLRFELELALIEGDLDVADLPVAWREGMRRLLGIDVPSDKLGCLQDVHWGAGSFGYFPSYAVGCLIAAQLWEALERDLGPRAEDLRRGEVSAIKEWLAEKVHVHGRRLDTFALVRQASGAALDARAFLRYAESLCAGG